VARETLSYSQSLRVIGQRLHGAEINSFELNKRGEEYIVRLVPGAFVRKVSREKKLSKCISEKILSDSLGGVPITLRFTISELLCSDDEEGLRRRKTGMPDIDNLSLVLRVLGDYLDRKAAGDFAISWSMDSVNVRYGQQEQRFTAHNLYDFAIVMYLKRSNHGPAKMIPPAAVGRPAATTVR
jgi:hypothetical protein